MFSKPLNSRLVTKFTFAKGLAKGKLGGVVDGS